MTMLQAITSTQNNQVKLWSQLLTKKGREEQRKFIVEGTHLVQEALISDVNIDCIVFSEKRGIPSEINSLVVQQKIKTNPVSESVLTKCSDTKSPQSVFAVIHRPSNEWNSLIEKENSLVVLIDGVQDPGNLGTIIRSADASGADGVLLGQGTVDLYNPKTLRSTMGSVFHLPVIECNIIDVLQQLKQETSIQVVSTSLQAKTSCYTSNFRSSTWFMFGNEGQGVSSEAGAYVNHSIKIPMQGKAESLNVAMAATILLFEALRQRQHNT
jgi:TrmH family RNA methyltransferase